MVQELRLLPPDPEGARLDAEIGRSLRRGPKGLVVFKTSPVPDFRKDSTEDAELSAANCARYEMYLRRLGAVGADPLQMRHRINYGVRRLYAVG